ncbi:MAG: glycosyltransferase family 9 protein [Bacteroidales bacterium]|nr:glycosyltransferase family 9 protein [Bacteroidales bacterium]
MKILIYRISSIGDIVLTSPIVRCLKKQRPEDELHFLTRECYAETMSENPYITKLWTVKKSPMEIADNLKKENFDCMIDLHKNIRSFSLLARLRIRYYTFNKLNFYKWIFTKFKKNLLPDIHIVDRYFKAVKNLNVKNDDLGLDFFMPKNIQIDAKIPEKYIVFAIGGTFFTKRYPKEKIVEFVKKSSLPVVLLGGKKDKENASFIEKSNSDKVFNLCAKLSLYGSAEIIKNASVVVSNDTGMMHIAAALHKPTVSIWGNTVPAFGMYPYFPKEIKENYVIIENKNLKCRPCSKLGFDSCPKKHFDCMQKIEADLIVDAVEKLMKNNT